MEDVEIQEKVKEEKQEEATKEKQEERETKNIVEEAKKAAEIIQKANIEKKELLDREEKILERREALKALGGDSMKERPLEKKEESDKDYAQRVMEGRI